jgi:predicted P-loop ATPase/GTPase
MNPFDSGKTTFSTLAVKKASEEGISVEYFKPLSAHNYWYNYSHTQTCLEREMLFSADVATVRETIVSKVHEYVSNPIHRLYVPSVSEKPLSGVLSTLGFAGWDSIIAMQRISTPADKRILSKTLVARSLIDSGKLILTPDEANRLTKGTDKVEISSLEELRSLEQTHFEDCISAAFSDTERVADLVIIESFNDTIWPWEGLDHVDVVWVIGPGQIFRYDSERIRKASMIQKRANLPLREVTFSRVVDLLKPIGRDTWSPLELTSSEMAEELLPE